MPCPRCAPTYQTPLTAKTLPLQRIRPVVRISEGRSVRFQRRTASIQVDGQNINDFGASAPASVLYEKFGAVAKAVVATAHKLLDY